MSTEQNKDLIRRFSDLINAHDADGAFALCTSDFVDHELPPGTPPGAESSRRFFEGQFAAFPDLQATMTDIVAEGDRVVIRMTIEGTHQGLLMGIPPTGKHVKWTLISLHRIADGKIAEHWGENDTMGLMQQLGVIPPPPGGMQPPGGGQPLSDLTQLDSGTAQPSQGAPGGALPGRQQPSGEGQSTSGGRQPDGWVRAAAD